VMDRDNRMRVCALKVLLIDVDRTFTKPVKEALASSGHNVRVVCHHRLLTGLEYLEQGSIEIVLLAVSPYQDRDLDTLSSVLQRAADVPVVVLMDGTDPRQAIHAIQKGAQDCLFKRELNGQSLVHAIQYALYNKEIEEGLKESKARYHAIFHSKLTCVFVHDFAGRFIDANEAALNMLGYERDELYSHRFSTLIHPDRAESASRMFQTIHKKGRHEDPVEYMMMRKDGRPVWVEVEGTLIYRYGKPNAIQITARDITQRKKAEEAQRLSTEKLKQHNQRKSDFISTVSHELRTPIATMREGVSLCLDRVAGEITQTQGELLTDTLHSIDRMERLVTDLLDLSRIEAGKMELRRTVLDVCEVSKKVQQEYLTIAAEKGIELDIRLPDVPIILYADGDKITQILSNLLNNAIRFTEPGGRIVISVEEDDDFVRCAVSDTGIGIAEEYIPKLFSKFTQVGRTDGPGYKGTGLGLAIVKGLVERHGGSISVNSMQGKGSTFTFTLKKTLFPKILIVEDDPNYIEVITRFLKTQGYRFITANDGEQALRLARAELPSLIILDLMLPGMNGYEVIGRLKHDSRTLDIPILISSGFDVDNEQLDRLNNHSTIPVMKKPFIPDDLRLRIGELLVG
jgi:PAS domain S-box-containing protein